ncbi:transcriptional regulator [Streptomyces tendae]|nr:transcriptional regulator [Streptomyces tendae]
MTTLEDLARLRRARDLMDREYAEPLDVPALARVALMSAGHFSRSFRAAYGETPYSYLMTRRIERAMALLRRGDMSVTEVCFAVGCTSLGSFSSRFTELVGESPSAYRERDHTDGAALPACVAKVYTRPVRNGEQARNEPFTTGEPVRNKPFATGEPVRNKPFATGEPVRNGEATPAPPTVA